MGFFDKIKNGLKKTREAIASTIGNVFTVFRAVDEEFYEELEESMILADIGVDTSCKAVELLRKVENSLSLLVALVGEGTESCLIDSRECGFGC